MGDVTSGSVLRFLAQFTWPWAPTQQAIFWLKLIWILGYHGGLPINVWKRSD